MITTVAIKFVVFCTMVSVATTGCGAILGVAGVSGPAVQLLKGVELAKTAYDISQWSKDKKTTTDTIVSSVLDKDCSVNNILKDNIYCSIPPPIEKTATEKMKDFVKDMIAELENEKDNE